MSNLPAGKKRVGGRDVKVIASKAANATTGLSNWTKFSGHSEIGQDEASAASSKYEQWTPGKRKATVKFEGFIGGAENLDQLPQEGDELLTIAVKTVTSGADLISRFSDEDLYGKFVVISTDYEQTDKPGTYSFEARSGGEPDSEVEDNGAGGGGGA